MSKLFSLNKKITKGLSGMFALWAGLFFGFFGTGGSDSDAEFAKGATIVGVAHADTPFDQRDGHNHGGGGDLDCFDPSGGINPAFDPDGAAPGSGGGSGSSGGPGDACIDGPGCIY